MKRLYDKLRPGCPKDNVGVPLASGQQSDTSPARAIKSKAPPTPANPHIGLGIQSASLERLPLELKYEVFQRLADLPSLNAIVHASPSYHKAYRARRQSILTKVLSQDIGQDVLFEANAVAMALTINKKDYREIRHFAENYKNARRTPTTVSLEGFSLRHIVTLSQVQFAVRFAVKGFCQAMLSRHPLSGEKQEQIMPISRNEARRITRAFYRLELFCTIFSLTSLEVSKRWDCMDMCHLFLNQFPPWEVEEIACVRDYIIDRYRQLFAKYVDELARPRPQKPPEDSSGDEQPFIDELLEEYAEHCLSHGLRFLPKIAQASPFDQVRMLKKNLIDTHVFLTRALGEQPYDYVYVTDAYDDWMAKSPLRFVDDSEGPNAAWTWSNGDIVELFSFQGLKFDLRKWGYVMWDKERLDRWGVLKCSNNEYVRQHYD